MGGDDGERTPAERLERNAAHHVFELRIRGGPDHGRSAKASRGGSEHGKDLGRRGGGEVAGCSGGGEDGGDEEEREEHMDSRAAKQYQFSLISSSIREKMPLRSWACRRLVEAQEFQERCCWRRGVKGRRASCVVRRFEPAL